MESKTPQVKDYYYILGVSPDATQEEIAEAYQELNDKYGPHVTLKQEDADAHMTAYKDITDAWNTLSVPEKRREYDKVNLSLLQKSHLRNLWGKFAGMGGQTGEHGKQQQQQQQQQLNQQSQSHQTESKQPVEITLYEAMKGTRRQIRVDDSQPCQMCTGKKPVEKLKCVMCKGVGILRHDRPEDIDIPPGTPDRSTLRLQGKGKIDSRQVKRDLLLEIQIQPHDFFSILGNDICCTVPVNVYEAVLGGEIDIPTPTGKVVMKIQPLTQRGRVYRLKGLGLGGGDLLATIEVNVPQQLNTEEVMLFRKLKDVSSQPNPRTEIHAKLKESRPTPQS